MTVEQFPTWGPVVISLVAAGFSVAAAIEVWRIKRINDRTKRINERRRK